MGALKYWNGHEKRMRKKDKKDSEAYGRSYIIREILKNELGKRVNTVLIKALVEEREKRDSNDKS